MIALQWWYSATQEEGHVTRTPVEVDVVLDILVGMSRDDWPAMAEVTRADSEDLRAPILSVGFHVDRGVLMYSGPDNRAGSHSFDGGPDEGEPILYMQGTSDNLFPPNSEIPADVVRRAVHEFAETYQRPTGVPWQPVRGGRWV
ncbi:MAG TPA: Imm1 family immunity protein [Pseudonocardiaceae bacterium]|nr:Imm1 family immunity protein [Pseudonocardiaceae bacterium]